MKASLLALIVLGLAQVVTGTPITFIASLSGANENPATNSAGTGFATVIIDSATNLMEVNVQFSGLLTVTGTGAPSGTTASHIHCCVAPGGNAGVATTTPTFPGFPLGVTSGSYDQIFNMTLATSYNPAFVTAEGGLAAAEAALFAGMAAGQTYLNIHSTTFPGGEIRGFLVATPEPGTWLLLSAALLPLAFRRRR
ncbi:MAG TPA: CHRD domain-containing protein [Bryobacteraceae bacterium]|nr:CHRD domain-containing protein [Bryobacteraceae bacterium]